MARLKRSKSTAPKSQGEAAQAPLFVPLASRNKSVDLDSLMLEINKEFGDNALIYANNESVNQKRPSISTGSLSVDYLSKGYSKGRINTVSGESGTGKSHLAYKAIAWYQRMFPHEAIVLIDAEDSYEEDFAIMAGIDVTRLLIHKPESLEEALNLARRVQKAGAGLIVVDSIESLATEKDLDVDHGDSSQMGVKQKMISTFLKVITNRNNRARRDGEDGCTFILVLQLRTKMGVSFGDPMFETGGKALEYYPHSKFRLMESKKERDDKTKKIKRSLITVTVNKSRLVGKGVSTTYYFNYYTTDGTPTGIDHYLELVDIAEQEGLIEAVSAQKISILGEIECKRTDVKKELLKNPELLNTLYAQVMDILKERMGHNTEEDNLIGSEEESNPKLEDSNKKRTRGRPRGKSK